MNGPLELRPLHWQKTQPTPDTSIHTADTPLGTCSIVASTSGQVWYCGFLGETLEADRRCASLPQAKQIAQQEFERIILECLSTQRS